MTRLALLALALITAAGMRATATGSVPVRIAMKSGSQQSAHAWAAPGTKLYETKFDDALVVTVSPPDAKVRFRCITRGCILPPQEQGEGINRADASAFDVDAEGGIASIKLIVRSPSVQPIVVAAQAANKPHGPIVRFVLNAR
jgi:hypothetical protein